MEAMSGGAETEMPFDSTRMVDGGYEAFVEYQAETSDDETERINQVLSVSIPSLTATNHHLYLTRAASDINYVTLTPGAAIRRDRYPGSSDPGSIIYVLGEPM